MKTTWIIAAVMAMGFSVHHVGSAHAQVHGGADHKKAAVHNDLDKAAKLVNATPEQMKKMKALHQQTMNKANALKSRKDLNEVQLKKGLEALHHDAFSQLKTILRPEQLKKLHAVMMMHGGWNKQHDPMEIMQKLDLNDAQKVQVKQIIARTHESIEALMRDTSLTDQQKHARAQELHDQALAQIHGVLTPEQSKKAHEIWSKHHGDQGGHKNPPPART